MDTAVLVQGQMGGARQAQHFSPYDENGGSIVAVAGNDFAVIGSDTRLATGYSIYTREQSKLFPLGGNTVLGCSGCWCDSISLTKLIDVRMKMYIHEHNTPMSTTAVAQLLSTLLYYKRFFPYYVSNVLAGLDGDGKGVVYHYDPVGHVEKLTFSAGGSAGALLQPLLDNQVGLKNMQNVKHSDITQEKALGLIKDVFIAAAERDIYTGDGIDIRIITKDGTTKQHFALRKD